MTVVNCYIVCTFVDVLVHSCNEGLIAWTIILAIFLFAALIYMYVFPSAMFYNTDALCVVISYNYLLQRGKDTVFCNFTVGGFMFIGRLVTNVTCDLWLIVFIKR